MMYVSFELHASHMYRDIQIGTINADFQAVPHGGEKDQTKLLMTFVARNMAGSLVSRKLWLQLFVQDCGEDIKLRHAADLYCLYGDYPGCCQKKPSPVGAEAPADFCEMHLQQAKEEG